MFLSMFFWAVLLTPSSLGLGHNPEGKPATGTHTPAWTVDLRSVGFTGFAPKGEQWGLHLRPNPLCFADRRTLIATFITREDVTTLARRDQPGETLPLRLHGIFLDANAGKVRTTKEWSITRPRGGIIAAGGGNFVVLTPAMVALYSAGLELVKDFKLSSQQQSHLWDFHSSPTGRVILVEYHYPEAKYQWLDTDTLLAQSASWSESLPVLSISDDKEITSFRDTYVRSKAINIYEALIQPRDRPERAVCRVIAGHGDDSCGDPEILSNELLALWSPHEFRVVPKTGGDTLLKASFREDEWLGSYPSADGKRFAVTVSTHKGGSAFFDIDYHSVLKRIEIYDIPNPHPVYTLDTKLQKIKTVSGVALSPDGSLLAIVTDGVVEVYQLSPDRIDPR